MSRTPHHGACSDRYSRRASCGGDAIDESSSGIFGRQGHQTESATFEQHVYYTPTKERTEMQASGKNAEQMPVQILRKDNKVMWQLMPSQKMYMEYSLDRPAPTP